ncbi:Fanconi anemia group M protein, partial [Araneus ventricosus]
QNVFSKTADQLVDKGFDNEAGKTWIYPTNYPVRDYQFAIVKESLFKNTLVILPTGLGKTFIAAVVMYNIYRWYPSGKIIFMAPTRPLVAQQIDACYKVTGISHADTTQMTGTNQPEERKRMWMKKRVFFLTPQVLVNDLARNICPAESIKCLVVDEAHKALGNYAYCQVIKELQAYTTHFRILALTATPGSDTQAVKLLLSNLLISHVEMRTEDSDDVKPYTHIRDIEKIVVPLGDRLLSIKSKFLDIINVYLKRLTQRRAMTAKNPSSLSKFQILRMRDDFSQHPPSNIDKFAYGLIMADFSLCISLYHAYELLLLHGARSFYNFLTGIINGEKSIPHARSELQKNCDFDVLLKEIQENYIVENIEENQIRGSGFNSKKPGHPKLEKLLEVVLRHFNCVNKDKNTRVMIFSQYRDSVQEIKDMLNHYKPMIKVMSFIGQASKSGTNAGFTQKQQLKVIQQFRSGGYNTLVSTCVGEEGLDIGEVDLIVCYDCPKSPIRLVQRMGRTGRLRGGKIIILIAEGKEEQMYNSCESKKKSVHRAISKGFAFAQLYNNSPSLIPSGVKPMCVKTVVTVETQKAPSKSKGKSKEDGLLNEDELNEFKACFEIPKSEHPLLQNSEIVCLKGSQAQESKSAQGTPADKILHSDQSILSLSNWLLWQTTPQRTHMVSHSSKTLLLTETLERINFYTERNFQNVIDKEPMYSLERLNSLPVKNLNPPLIDLSDDENIAFDFDESLPMIERNDLVQDKTVQDSVKAKSPFITNFSKPILPTNLPVNAVSSNISQEGNLLKRMFGISAIELSCEFQDQELLPPPVISDFVTFQSVSIESTAQNKSKSCLILNILNKKMKARLRRKTKELGINFSFGENFEFSCKKNSIATSVVNLSQVKGNTLDISLNVPKVDKISNLETDNKLDEILLPKCITFDIDFDAPQMTDEGDSPQTTIAGNRQNILETISTDLKESFDVDFDAPQATDECDNLQVTDESNLHQAIDADNHQIIHNISNDRKGSEKTAIAGNHQNILQTKSTDLKESFDIHFDALQAVDEFNHLQVTDEDNLQQAIDSDCHQNIIQTISTDRKALEENFSLNQKEKNDIHSLDGDSFKILQQFFGNKEDAVKKLESSFTLPLTVKKVIFDKSNETPKSTQSKSRVLRDKNISVLRSYNNKFKRLGSISPHSNNQSNEVRQENNTSKVLNINKKNVSDNSGNHIKNSNENEEFSQYTLTQLLSLIDGTESSEITIGNKNTANTLGVPKPSTPKKNMSSDDEIEPTPPKRIITSTSKFFYRSNSFNLDLDSVPKNDISKDKLEMLSCPAISFDLSDIQSPQKHGIDIVASKQSAYPVSMKKHLQNTNQNNPELKNSETLTVGFSKDDLSEGMINTLFPTKDQESKFYNKQLTAKELNPCEMKIVSSPKNYDSNISFDLFDVDSPKCESSKKTLKPFESFNETYEFYQNQKSKSHAFSSTAVNAKTGSSFDLSGVKITECGVTKPEHLAICKSNCKDEGQLFETNITSNPTNSLPAISFDLSDMQFPQLDEEKGDNDAKNFVKPKSSPSINTSNKNKDEHSPVFESAAAENIFFDIAFDFPDLQDSSPQKDLPFEQNGSVTENIPLKTSEDCLKGLDLDKNLEIAANFPLKNQSISRSNDALKVPSNNDKFFQDTKSKTLSVTQKSDRKTANKDIFNKYIQNDFDLSNSEDFIMPQKLNYKKSKITSTGTNEKQSNCIGIRNSNPKNSKSETLSTTCKYKQAENVSPECSSDKINNFKKPLSKLSRAVSSCVKPKKKKINNKNDLLLSQASVSGSESTGEDDEDLDALEESFIDDNTLLESPPNQHCMYLESVKNVAGLPQKYKLKAAQNWVNPEPVDEGCSKYLLDSFCVDDDEVMFTSSDDELEGRRKNTKVNNVGKKRRRIVTFSESSSDEETFVKRIKLPEEGSMKKMTPVSSIEHKPKFCRKLNQKFITSSNEDGHGDVGISMSSLAKGSNEQLHGKASAELPVSDLSNIMPVHSESELVKKNDDLRDTELNCPNFSFDLEWDDAIPPSEFLGDKDNEIIIQNESKNYPLPSTTKIRDESSALRHQTVSAKSHIYTAANNVQNFSNKNQVSFAASARNHTFSSIRNITPTADIADGLMNSTVNISSATSVSINNVADKRDTNKTILVDSRELASGKPVISALRNKYGMNPVVMQLSAADYIISNKIAVERILDSDFPSSAIPLKIIEKVKAMSELYEKPFVIIETDGRKRSLGFNKFGTKHLQFSLQVCLHPSIKVLYSNSVEDTCNILHNLYEKEKQKGLHINVPVALNSSSQKLFNFYNSLPHVSPVCALNFAYHFPSVYRFFKSSADELKKASSISSNKAKAIIQYLKSELLFDAFS